MDLFLFVFAFMMGLMSLLSPCVLPVIPSYVAFLFGREKTGIIMGACHVYWDIRWRRRSGDPTLISWASS
ncbi:MAG: hypothetical protein DSO08_03020 [Candidatus Methanomethylicota archaeon]|uniref:Uncharacterized protein n=1 Tax=Thermoproteota archaeon TaxID=2056631 RepID=A0A523BE14_9CREN|nr:MAG: hypothetical protein DSO08_03020 [Candidatus Verstraetearchaeota archaeon]